MTDIRSIGAHRSLSDWCRTRLRCPRCTQAVTLSESQVLCQGCGQLYPVVDGVPILVDEQRSVFRFSDFTERRSTYFREPQPVLSRFQRWVPEISNNLSARRNFPILNRLLRRESRRPVVLVVGSGLEGEGIDRLRPGVDLVFTDVSLGPDVCLVCDGHDLPFERGTFDAVVAQAVLEHVVDPVRCVSEFHRVLRAHGLVYAETPFIQHVHGGHYDFSRFSHLGHRVLFGSFDEITSGVSSGPGMALAWSVEYYLMCLVKRRFAKRVMRAVARLLFWPLKDLDPLLIGNRSAYDASSGYYFVGRRRDSPIPARELLAAYRGALAD